MDLDLPALWFVLIAFLWTGYLVLEGFDFGVGALLRLLARDRTERRVMLTTIGPVWDGNEVWLITAGAATFAAFPEWYASMFSAFYLPLLLVLLALIARNVALEFRHKRPDPRWQDRWEWTVVVGSIVPALVWGVAFANLMAGVPMDADGVYVGTVLDLFSGYTLLGGLVTLSVFLSHGSAFIALKTVGDLRLRARRFAVITGVVAAASAVPFLWLTVDRYVEPTLSTASWATGTAIATAVLFVAGLAAVARGREGWGFAGTAFAIVAFTATVFLTLFPRVMVSSLDPAWSLTIRTASSTDYTLGIMSIAALVITPVVIAYQAWTYWVFRKRLGVQHMPAEQGAERTEQDAAS